MTKVGKLFGKLPFMVKARARRGYSLIELGIVLGVVAGLIVGVLFLAQNVSTQNKLAQTNNLITRVVAATYRIVDLDGGTTDSANLGTLLKETGEFPANVFDASDDLKLPFSGLKIEVEGETNDRFIVTIENLPQNVCFNVSQNLLLSRDAMESFKIATTTYTAGGTAGTTTGDLNDLKASGVATKCVATAATNDIVAVFN